MTDEVSGRGRAGWGLVWVGAALLVVGLVGGVLGAAALTVSVGRDVVTVFTAEAKETPATLVRKLDEGTYLVYERTASYPGAAGGTVTVDPADVTVTAPDGSPVPTEVPRWPETITRGAAAYTGAVQFTAEQEGVYHVTVATPDTVVILAPGLGSIFTGSVEWIAVVGLSGLMFLLGIVLLLVGLLPGRSKSAPSIPVTPPAARSAPAGWYPDPRGAATLRWWNGTAWTEHVH